MTIRHGCSLLMAALVVLMSPPGYGEESDPDSAGTDPGAAQQPATPPPPPKNPPLPLDLQWGKLLAQELAADQEKKGSVTWFREGQKGAYLGLYTENFGREPQGYALILHDNQQHPDWPGIVHYLRTQLPAKGWSTLSISLPMDWNLTEAPPRDDSNIVVQTEAAPPGETSEADGQAPESDSSASEATNSETSTPDQENTTPPLAAEPAGKEISYTQLSVEYPPEELPNIIQGRIGEALQFLQNRDPMPIIVIAVGTSATYAAKQVHNLRMRDIAGLVIVDPKAVDQEGFDVNSDAPGLRIPVLDLVPEFHPRADPTARLKAARRQARKAYEQQTVSGASPAFKGYEEFVAKAIRGWAKRVIIDKKRFGYL